MSLFSPEPSDSADQEHHAPELERRFLRMGVEGMRAERRECTRCGRSPLVGERLSEFGSEEGRREALCDTCVVQDSKLGEPLRVYRMHASERRLNVTRAA